MDLIYKIYSVWLYQNQLNHDYVFFYNRRKDLSGFDRWDVSAPGYMFGNYDWSASTQIFRMDKNDPHFKEKSVSIMKVEADKAGVLMMKGSEFISLITLGDSQVSYSGAFSPEDIVETEGEYKGLKKNIYTPYDIMWNETKSGFNPHEFEIMGVWNVGQSSYSIYRIWQEVDQREKTIRDNKLNTILE